MSSVLTQLEEQIVGILNSAEGKTLSLPRIAELLAKNGPGELDTFDVRDAVWKLVNKGRADFTPRLHVKLIDG